MQSLGRNSPISVLHEDLLWKIFSMNTQIDFTDDYHDLPNIPSGHNRPLNVARHCSQVCRRWRTILLSSSSIWGRLIDLDGLRQKTDEWRTEVVARSGESLLWVYGEVESNHDFPFDFLKSNWGRIERLLITDNGRRYQQSRPTCLDTQTKWAFLKEPAPLLQSIRLYLLYNPNTSLPSYFLSDDCPLLRSIGIFDAEYRFSINSSWLPNLSSVTFSSQFTTGEVLHALQKMPELVSLTVFNRDGTNSVSDRQLEFYPQITLPKLRMLTLDDLDLRSASTILQCVTPSPDCSLVTEWMGMPTPGSDSEDYEQYEQYEKGVTSYIVPYFSLHPPSPIELHFSINRDVVFLKSPSFTRFGGPDHPRRFSIELYFSHLPSSSLIKELINSGSFSRVTTLHMPIFIMRTTPGAALDLIYILEAFSSLKTLSTTDFTLQSLLHYRDRMSTLFPVLVTLEVTRRAQREWLGWKRDVPAHERFLNLRREIGRPIAVLDLGCLQELQRDRDHLEVEHPGLLVKWSISPIGGERCTEYRCGDGQPEKLRSSSTYR